MYLVNWHRNSNNTEFYDRIIRLFLYGHEDLPSNLIDAAIIRPDGVRTRIEVDTASYMVGPGRFALPSQLGLVQEITVPVY